MKIKRKVSIIKLKGFRPEVLMCDINPITIIMIIVNMIQIHTQMSNNLIIITLKKIIIRKVLRIKIIIQMTTLQIIIIITILEC